MREAKNGERAGYDYDTKEYSHNLIPILLAMAISGALCCGPCNYSAMEALSKYEKVYHRLTFQE